MDGFKMDPCRDHSETGPSVLLGTITFKAARDAGIPPSFSSTVQVLFTH